LYVLRTKSKRKIMPQILTTHDELVPLLLARDHGKPYDAAAFDRLVQAAVVDAVAKQEAAGVSIVSDGERSSSISTPASTIFAAFPRR
jgi:hypothetical protein